jgi:hypothetical protein
MCTIGSNEVTEGGYKVSDVCRRCLRHARGMLVGA